MPLPIHNQKGTSLDIKTFQAGSSYSTEEQFIGSTSEGKYKDAVNMRPNGNDQDDYSLEQIKGESIEYPSEDSSCNGYYGINFATGDWRCMGTAYIKGHQVEMWAEESQALDPFIRVDGIIVAASPGLGQVLDTRYPIQYHWNHTCKGGEIYITNFKELPIILNIKDMVDNSTAPLCTEKYFSEFDIRAYQVNVEIPANHFVFKELTNNPGYPGFIIGSGGLKGGQYCYSFRYVATTGDRTAWTPTTPLIPVSMTVNQQSPAYPYIKTYGADPATQSGFGCVLEVRIDNELDYDFIEIKRYSYNTGAPVGFTPGAELIGTYPLVPGQFDTVIIVDLGGTGEPITDGEDTEVGAPIQACKTLRYFENRLYLMNVKYASMDIQPAFVSNARPNMFPVLTRMDRVGNNDAWFSSYARGYFRGEKYGFAVGLWNTLMGRTFASPVTGFQNYQMPERRDEASALSVAFSYYGMPTAPTYQTNAIPTAVNCYEVYDYSLGGQKKTDCCSFKNILCDGSKGAGCDGSDGINNQPAFCGSCETPSLPVSVTDGRIGYRPLRPFGESDSDVSGHNFLINTRMANNCSGLTPFQPEAFGPVYYSLNMMLNGIQKSSLPSYIQAFSVVRTRPAGRIVCQGIGMYYLYPDGGSNRPANKDLDRMWFYSWEASPRSGLISQSLIDSIGANSDGRYHMQLVSPVSFFPEIPWFDRRGGLFDGKNPADMIIYPKYYYDPTIVNLSPDPTSSGIDYVLFGKWRNAGFPASAWMTNLATDKASMVLSEFRPANNGGTDTSGVGSEYIGDRGGDYFVISPDVANYGALYSATSVGLNACDDSYDSTDAKNFHEPFYNVNIVDTLANVPVQDITEYLDTGIYVKVRSRIGIVTTSTTSYKLVDERWEDVHPYIANNIPTGTIAEVDANPLNSIIEIVRPNGNVDNYLNVDGVPGAAVTALLALMPFTITGASKTGTTISGTYTTTIGTHFGVRRSDYTTVQGLQPAVPVGSSIYVLYDEEAPVTVGGGDAYVGDDIFSPVDRKQPNGGGDPAGQGTDTPFPLFLPFPYRRFQVNPRLFVANNASGGTNKVQDCSEGALEYVRQMACMFNTESRIHVALAHEVNIGNDFGVVLNKFFPATNYIMRPSEWDTTLDNNKCSNGGNIFDEYYSDYPGEDTIWRYGGYRFFPQYNIDYMHSNNVQLWVSKPATGYKEQLEYCTRVAYSLLRDISKANAPGIRTFLPQNVYDCDDQTGEIKFAWSALGGAKGNNLYALTDRGCCLLMTNKTTLSDATGNPIGLSSSDRVIGDEQWISIDIGMNNEMWRSRAEYNNMLFFANLTSAYMLADNQLADIGREGYHAMLYNNFLRTIDGSYSAPAGLGTYVTGVFDTYHNEYLLQININDAPQGAYLMAYSVRNKSWNGRYTYGYDYYLGYDNRLKGMGRNIDGGLASSYVLNSGTTINGVVIVSRVIQVSAESQILAKEFQGIRVISNVVPDAVRFYDTVLQQQSGSIQAEVLAVDLRDYGRGYEQYIGRRIAPPNDRMQGTALVYEIIHSSLGDFKIVDAGIYWKPLI